MITDFSREKLEKKSISHEGYSFVLEENDDKKP